MIQNLNSMLIPEGQGSKKSQDKKVISGPFFKFFNAN
jgi:hypothetical protein